MTTNMILFGVKENQEFFFVTRPAPGSRKLSLVGFKLLHEIEQMYFVSSTHIMLNFRGDKLVILLSNGTIVHQHSSIEKLMERLDKVKCESQV